MVFSFKVHNLLRLLFRHTERIVPPGTAVRAVVASHSHQPKGRLPDNLDVSLIDRQVRVVQYLDSAKPWYKLLSPDTGVLPRIQILVVGDHPANSVDRYVLDCVTAILAVPFHSSPYIRLNSQ